VQGAPNILFSGAIISLGIVNYMAYASKNLEFKSSVLVASGVYHFFAFGKITFPISLTFQVGLLSRFYTETNVPLVENGFGSALHASAVVASFVFAGRR
jgi:hypothetical protein